METIVVRDLKRTFHTSVGVFRRRRLSVEALRGLNLTVEQGRLSGLLGPNGAGKTTTIRILTTLLLPTSGSAYVLGFDVATQAREVRKRVGTIFGGDRGSYERLSALDNLRYFAELYGLPAGTQRRKIGEVLELVGLRGRENERVEGYSRGMRQRLHIARSLLHDPDVLFLDEPSLGIDPVGARQLRETIQALVGAGKTILLTTHYMAEADALCDHIAVIARGRIVAEGTPQELKAGVQDGRVLEIEAYGASPDGLDEIRRLGGVRSFAVEERGLAQVLTIQVEAGVEVTQPVLARLAGVSIGRVTMREPTLEDAYVALVS